MYFSTSRDRINPSPLNGEPPGAGSSPDQPTHDVGTGQTLRDHGIEDSLEGRRDRDNELIQVKVRRKTWRTLKAVSAWKEKDIADYVEELVSREGLHDVGKVLEEIEHRQKHR